MTYFSRSKRRKILDSFWLRIPVAALGLAFVLAGFWVAVQATREDIYQRRVSAQIFATASTAFDLKLDPLALGQDNLNALFRRLQLSGDRLQVIPDPAKPPGFMINPWQQRLEFNLLQVPTGNAAQPTGLLLDLVSTMPHVACRFVLGQFSNDSLAVFRLSQVTVMSADGVGGSRLLYNNDLNVVRLKPDAIVAACGNTGMVKLRLVFKLFAD